MWDIYNQIFIASINTIVTEKSSIFLLTEKDAPISATSQCRIIRQKKLHTHTYTHNVTTLEAPSNQSQTSLTLILSSHAVDPDSWKNQQAHYK